MPNPTIRLDELAAAVQNAVEQTLAKHGAVPVEHLWIGFVAPENIATLHNAQAVAAPLAKETAAAGATGSVAQISAGGVGAAAAAVPGRPGHIIGIIYNPQIKR